MSKRKIIPQHQFTHEGDEVLIMRCSDKDGESYGGFQWPLTVGAKVEAPDWSKEQKCGGGLHGWPWGFQIGNGKDADFSGLWIVFGSQPEDIVDVDGKCKAKCGTIRYVGDFHGAQILTFLGRAAWTKQASSGAATASGDSGAATASGYSGAATASGYSGAATASGHSGAATASGDSGAATASGDSGAATASGDNGAATASGDSGAATASGYSGAATASGDSGAATASGYSGAATASGYSGAATASGDSGAATASGLALAATVTGLHGRAKAPEFGSIALAWRNKKENRNEMRCAMVGKKKGQLNPDTFYQLDENGEFQTV